MQARGLSRLLLCLLLATSTVRAAALTWPGEIWDDTQPDAQLQRAVERAFSAEAPELLGGVRAVVVAQAGRLVAERYREGFDVHTRFISWSMAKSFTHALAGIMVRKGRLKLDAPLPVAEWPAGDPRHAITLDNALRMSTGLEFLEDYEALASSDVIRMLFGDAARDMGAFAASKPLIHVPGTHWAYSSGTTNIVSRVIRDLTGGNEDSYRAFAERELLAPLGIREAVLEFDRAGTLIGSSLIFMPARDFARFGLLYLRGGEWSGRRILPAGWTEHARTPTPGSGGRYGAHWWLASYAPRKRLSRASLKFPADTFMAQGFGEQSIVVVPSRDLVLVCLSHISAQDVSELKDYLAEIVATSVPPLQ